MSEPLIIQPSLTFEMEFETVEPLVPVLLVQVPADTVITLQLPSAPETELMLQVPAPLVLVEQPPEPPSSPNLLSAEADQAITIGQALYVKSNGHLDLARADAAATADVRCVALSEALAPGQSVNYTADDLVQRTDWTPVTGTSQLTPGASYFLSPTTAGQLTTTAPSTTGQTVIQVGIALNPTILHVEIQPPILL